MHRSTSDDNVERLPGRQPGAAGAAAASSDVDPDVGAEDRAASSGSGSATLLAAIAIGGVLGAEARYGLSLALPHHAAEFPWSTLVVNVSGCLLIGVLMTVLLGMPAPPRLARPFLGVGVLGGYTTYSGFAVECQQLVLEHRPVLAAGYAAATVLAGAAAVWLAGALTTSVLARQRARAGLVRQR